MQPDANDFARNKYLSDRDWPKVGFQIFFSFFIIDSGLGVGSTRQYELLPYSLPC